MDCSRAFGFLSKGSRGVIPGAEAATILFPKRKEQCAAAAMTRFPKIKRAICRLADHPFFEIYGLNSFSV
jgi:hypothetical protein